MKRKPLGKGLDALLGLATESTKQVSISSQQKLSIDLLQRGQYQPRREIPEATLKELAQSIGEQGILQPILVRPLSKGRYEIIAGERRWRAAKIAGLDEIPVIIRNLPDQAVMCVALVENIQREDLNILEEAVGVARLLKEFSLTHAQIAKAIGRSRSAVSNLLRLLDLAPQAKTYLAAGKLEMGHARALLSLASVDQSRIADKVALEGLSVRATEALVKQLSQPSKKRPVSNRLDLDIQHLQNDISTRLAAKVTIQQHGSGGTLKIHYYSLDELDGILKHIK